MLPMGHVSLLKKRLTGPKLLLLIPAALSFRTRLSASVFLYHPDQGGMATDGQLVMLSAVEICDNTAVFSYVKSEQGHWLSRPLFR